MGVIMGTSLWSLALTLLQVCAGIRRQTVLTPLAPLRDLFSLLQAFPQGGALASPENIDRVQCQISDSYIFPCAFTRGSNYYVRPNFVRDVGPADIDVVAGIGDHLVAGTAALANTTGDTFKNFPEVSFAMGGVGDWRTSTTIPNILRQFNPNLIGFSVGNFNGKGFNFAKAGAASKDLESQARDLVSAIEQDARIDMNTYWKLVVVSVGTMDLCVHSCSASDSLSSLQFEENVRRALDILLQLPNILVAVVSPPDPSIIQSALHRPVSCQVLTRSLCPCVTSNTAKPRSDFLSDLSSVRASLARVVSSSQYQERMNAGGGLHMGPPWTTFCSPSGVMLLTGLHSLTLPPDEALNL